MKVSLLFGFLTGLGWAADLNVWDFDDSCTPHHDALEKAYNDAERMAVKAQQDLETLQDQRPEYPAGRVNNISNWDRIARAVTNMFGFVPDKGGHSPTEEHYSNVLYVFDRMVTTLHENKMVPENGYGGLKPLMVCGDDMWTWVGRDDTDPNDAAQRPLHESRADDIQTAHSGAWVYKNRYLAAVNKDSSVGICRPGIWAVTLMRFDLLIFCPPSFSEEVAQTPSAVDARDGIKIGDKLDTFGHTSLSRIMVHELAHWFGSDGAGGMSNRRVPDQPMVGAHGDFVYLDPSTNKRTTKTNVPGAKQLVTYDYLWASNLARTHTGPNAGNTGPSKATFTAETYAIFAMMTYMDNFDWADDGKAKDPTLMIPYEVLPNKRRRLDE
ncbi:hypothetical protein B0J13DRAFT_454057 [Dactylonectria estremocensis]|uniref:Lysine-specific metallo-endopeptidase domain-containing protein n=1 Tax=Dactylonectria estremocensis TaxID=1079267 RepID=A0A9P9IPN6_9HYPO|nr:hypothetical protein B0J13DRAFT_454057 [Dactylonectria estremocensis]